MESVGGKKSICDWLKDAVTKASHLQNSATSLLEDRGLRLGSMLDTVVVAWDCEDWVASKGWKWIEESAVNVRSNQPILVQILPSPRLDRLVVLSEFASSHKSVEFGYPELGDRRSPWSATLAPELLSSDFIVVRFKRNEVGPYTHGVILFETEEATTASFSLGFAATRGLFQHDELTFFSPAGSSRIESLRAGIDSEMSVLARQHPGMSYPTVSVEAINSMKFES